MAPFVTYALLAACAVILVAGLALDRRGGRFQRYAWVLQVLSFVAAYFVLRPGRAHDPAGSLSQATAARAPVFLDMYSNY